MAKTNQRDDFISIESKQFVSLIIHYITRSFSSREEGGKKGSV